MNNRHLAWISVHKPASDSDRFVEFDVRSLDYEKIGVVRNTLSDMLLRSFGSTAFRAFISENPDFEAEVEETLVQVWNLGRNAQLDHMNVMSIHESNMKFINLFKAVLQLKADVCT